jgi:hypothetical protein
VTPPPPPSSLRPWAAIIAGACLLLLALGAPAVDGLRHVESWITGEAPDACAFRARYGIDCLGCGGTRAFAAASRVRLGEAFAHNRLGAMLGLATWALLLGAAGSWVARQASYLWGALALVLAVLSVTIAAHGLLWWRSLPPGFHLR